MDDDPIVWSLCGATVTIADDACFSSKFTPNGEHRLLVKKALDLLAKDNSLVTPSVVTVNDLPWPIKATIAPNMGRTPQWALHRQHDACQSASTDRRSPFVFMSRDHRPPMTKSLTFDLVGTNDHPAIQDVYPGHAVPPLPWQLDQYADLAVYENSVAFWQTHSFLYDIGFIATSLHDEAPPWYTYVPFSHTLLPR